MSHLELISWSHQLVKRICSTVTFCGHFLTGLDDLLIVICYSNSDKVLSIDVKFFGPDLRSTAHFRHVVGHGIWAWYQRQVRFTFVAHLNLHVLLLLELLGLQSWSILFLWASKAAGFLFEEHLRLIVACYLIKSTRYFLLWGCTRVCMFKRRTLICLWK